MEISAAIPSSYVTSQSGQNIETELTVAVLKNVKSISEENARGLINLVEDATSTEFPAPQIDFYA